MSHSYDTYRNRLATRARAGKTIRWIAVLATSSALAVACGGSKKGANRGGEQAGPAGILDDSSPITSTRKRKPKRKISRDARRDYAAAVDHFKQQKASGWNRDRCESAADKFAEVASDHPKLVEARYMTGLSYHQCGMNSEAERGYQSALEVDRNHALSLSNLGELQFQAGKVTEAQKYWKRALQADAKIAAARNNLAWLQLQKLRQTKPYSGAWKRMEEQLRNQLSNSLAVDTDNVKTYVLYALVYMEGWRRNKSRLDLARLLLEEGEKRDKSFAPLYNARGLLYMKRDAQGEALKNFRKAVELDPDFVEARMNVGNITLGFRKYDTAEAEFTKVLSIRPKSYDATIGLGVAQRGLGKLKEARESYEKAIELDRTRGEAYFNLGVLYKDFLANRVESLKDSQAAYQKAQSYFQTYSSKPGVTKSGKQEAKDNIADCKKIIKQIGDVLKAQSGS